MNKSAFVKDIEPKGNILNDTNSGVDHLGYVVYAQALARRIESVSTPVTIGIFAKWGSGKSFLVKHVKHLLTKSQHQQDIDNTRNNRSYQSRHAVCCAVRTFFLILLLALIILSSLWSASPSTFRHLFHHNTTLNVTESNNSNTSSYFKTKDFSDKKESMKFWEQTSRHLALGLLICSFVFASFVLCCYDRWFAHFFDNLRIIAYVTFTKLPIQPLRHSIVNESNDDDVTLQLEETLSTQKQVTNNKRYIFVNFNAWEYAGSDTLWAGIVTNLTDAIEAEFGVVTSRIFRMVSVETISKDEYCKRLQCATLFVKLPGVEEKTDVETIMKDFGVVRLCQSYNEWESKKKIFKKNENKLGRSWWVVKFANYTEMLTAKQMLQEEGVISTCDESFIFSMTKDSVNSIETNGYTHQNRFKRSNEEKYLLLEKNKSKQIDFSSLHNHNPGFFRHFVRYPKLSCRFPLLYWWIIIVASVIALPIMTYQVAKLLSLDVFRTPRYVPVEVQIFSWMPALSAAAFVIIKFVWAMFHSQRTRVHSALRGTKNNMVAELGFMDKVINEVRSINKFLKCVEFIEKRQYKVIISIDDLDRVPLGKVKSVLESVSILLSDQESPFVCLIAVDSRIAVKCVEEEMGVALLKANVNGHEYLKKIINLPFCLPEIEQVKKRNFISGLMDSSDKTNKHKMRRATYPSLKPAATVLEMDPKSIRTTRFHNSEFDGKIKKQNNALYKETNLNDTNYDAGSNDYPLFNEDETDASSSLSEVFISNTEDIKRQSPYRRSKSPTVLSDKKFLFECRQFLYANDSVMRHLQGNPRNIKRIFNVISLTALIISCMEEANRKESFRQSITRADRSSAVKSEKNKYLAHDLVIWIILTDQWPYRTSYVLQVIEDTEQRSLAGRCDNIDDDEALIDIFEKFVLPELKSLSNEDEARSLMSLDADPDIFYNFLKELKDTGNYVNKSRVKHLSRFTVNLDYSLRHSIAYHRVSISLNDQESFPAKVDSADQSKSPTASLCVLPPPLEGVDETID